MAQDFEKGIDVADVYAAALFALASEANAVDAVRGELEQIAQLAERDATFAAFAASRVIDADERTASLERIFRGRLSDLLLNTLHVMNRHDRLSLLQPLRRAFELRFEQARGEVEVLATSAVELDAAQRSEVARIAAKLSGRKPLVEYRIDPDVVGGLVLQVGDHRFDNSIRRHLGMARSQLLERTLRGEV